MDLYENWLGIPADRRPPTYYNLLGIEPFESNGETIERAALRRMSLVRHHQLGPHRDRSQEILSELARARLVLIDADRRGEYDAKLRARGEALPVLAVYRENGEGGEPNPHHVATTEAVPNHFPSIVVTDRDVDGSFTLRPRRKRRGSAWKRGVVTVACLMIHAVIIGGFIVLGPARIAELLWRVYYAMAGEPALPNGNPGPKPFLPRILRGGEFPPRVAPQDRVKELGRALPARRQRIDARRPRQRNLGRERQSAQRMPLMRISPRLRTSPA